MKAIEFDMPDGRRYRIRAKYIHQCAQEQKCTNGMALADIEADPSELQAMANRMTWTEVLKFKEQVLVDWNAWWQGTNKDVVDLDEDTPERFHGIPEGLHPKDITPPGKGQGQDQGLNQGVGSGRF